MLLRMKNLNISGVNLKIWLLEGGSQKTNIDGRLPKKGAWTVCWFKGGEGLATKRGEFWQYWDQYWLNSTFSDSKVNVSYKECQGKEFQ